MTELCYGPAISIRFFIAMAALLTPAVVAQDEGFVWEGLVVDEKWQPLVEATVRAKWMREIPGEEPKLVHGSRVRTNENGQYQITVPQKLRGLEAIVLHVRVSKAGYLTRNAKPIAVDSLFQNGKQEVAPEARAARRELTRMQVRRGRVIKGHVRLANGNPAVGAEVVVSTKPGEYDWKFPDPNRYYATGIAITDGDGNYELIGDLRASMRVQLSGHAEYSIALLPEGRADNPTPLTHNVRFPTGIRPSGTIVDSRGRPVANAIIRFVSAAPQNTGGDALWLSVVSTTDERGRYSFSPMPAGEYEVNVNSRLADPGRRDELKGNRGPYGSRRDLHARLNTVIPSKTVSLVDDEDAPQIDLFGVPTNTIRVKITQDEPVKTQPKRAPLIPITGTFGGKRWSGYSIPSVPNQSATFLVPKGLENASIKFSYALVKYPGDKEFLNATSIDIPRVDTNLDGYAIHLTSLARIKAKILLSDELSISKVGVLSIYLTECARHKSSGGKHFGRMEVGGRTNKFSTTLPPNVRFRLHVEAKQRSLHTQELTLKPGEVRQLEIDLRKVK